MKVKITKESKKCITLDDVGIANRLVKLFDTEDEDINYYAQMAYHACGGHGDAEILKAEARIAKNARVWDALDEGSKNFDIWFEFYAYDNYYGFYNIGCYWTDLVMLSSENIGETVSHMFVQHYKR